MKIKQIILEGDMVDGDALDLLLGGGINATNYGCTINQGCITNDECIINNGCTTNHGCTVNIKCNINNGTDQICQPGTGPVTP